MKNGGGTCLHFWALEREHGLKRSGGGPQASKRDVDLLSQTGTRFNVQSGREKKREEGKQLWPLMRGMTEARGLPTAEAIVVRKTLGEKRQNQPWGVEQNEFGSR